MRLAPSVDEVSCRVLRLALAPAVMLLLTACASQHKQLVRFPDQQVHVENPDKGRLYVIRDPWGFNIASHIGLVIVFDGDVHVGTIAGHRGFLCWEREPGETTIEAAVAGGGADRMKLAVEKGRVFYVLMHVGPDWKTLLPNSNNLGAIAVPGGGSVGVKLEVVDEERGRKELAGSHPPSSTPSSGK